MDGNDYAKKGLHQGGLGSQIDAGRSDFLKQAKVKAASFCAYQERTQQEVRDKLYSLKLHRDEVEAILSELITENFVNEERFAKTYARSKFNHNKWGRIKIKQGLQQKRISEYCQKIALTEIDDQAYYQQIEQLGSQKITTVKNTNPWVAKNKTASYLVGKGYESELVWEVLNGFIDYES